MQLPGYLCIREAASIVIYRLFLIIFASMWRVRTPAENICVTFRFHLPESGLLLSALREALLCGIG